MANYECGVNINTWNVLFDDVVSCKRETVLSLFESYVMSSYTLNNNIKNFFIRGCILGINKLSRKAVRYDKDNKKYYFKFNDSEYSFEKLSDRVPKSSYAKELGTFDRQHKCHIRSILLCYATPKSKIVTGYVNGKDLRVLHSIVVYESSDGTLVAADWTKNLVMPFEQYIKLHNFEIISEITHDDVIFDYESGIIDNSGLSSKTYCVFRNEVVNDIKKSIHL